MTVRFIQQWGAIPTGICLALSRDLAAVLIERGICMQVSILPPMEVR